ncbi:MAG: UDP-N-acetylmuramoyl-L-alanine--D-glutamate ligase [Armatimonadota bacterium]|nr:UDP-N-acetylmuramoyl-L-alanine--D-glutamate ligase [Armatimonadota bacterium]
MQREKVYAVIGLARAGVPAARFLAERGARVIGYDNKPLDQLSAEARALGESGVELRTGDHQFVGIAECDTVILSPGLKIYHEPLRSVVQECEARGAEVIGELELAARDCPAPIIAVTGTKGKSTTVKLITEMLQACGLDAIRAGNTGVPLIAELPNLSPDSWAVVEVSSFQLEKAPTFKPKIAVLLNLLADHLDYHPTLEQYWETKLKLFANQGAGDTAVFNVDDPRVADLASKQHNDFAFELWQRKVHVLHSSARIPGYFASIRDGRLGLQPEHQFVPIMEEDRIPLRGEHNKSNVAVALATIGAAVGDMTTVEHRQAIANTVYRFESLPHRLEIVGEVGDVTYVNDSQATIPDATIRAVSAFPTPITLIAGGRAKLDAPEAYDALGRAIAERVDRLITIGEAAAMIAGAARRAGFASEKIIDAQTLTNGVAQAKLYTLPGGTVILSPACASFDQFSSFEARGDAFRAAVAQLSLNEEQSTSQQNTTA